MVSRDVGLTRAVTQLLELLALSVCIMSGTAHAGEAFPGPTPDRNIIKTQEKVDSLVERGKYERAMFIYRHELAPLGDKYAQYMIGFMYLAGKGVEADVETAAAWYRLAAERQQETYVNEHAKLLSLLNDDQRRGAEIIYRQLRSELGDATLIAKLVEHDLESLRGRANGGTFSQVVVSRSNFERQDSQHAQIVKQIRARIAYLDGKLQTDPGVIDTERQRFETLAARAEREIQSFEASR